MIPKIINAFSVLFMLAIVGVFLVAGLKDLAREAQLKKKLGKDYEGPLADE